MLLGSASGLQRSLEKSDLSLTSTLKPASLSDNLGFIVLRDTLSSFEAENQGSGLADVGFRFTGTGKTHASRRHLERRIQKILA